MKVETNSPEDTKSKSRSKKVENGEIDSSEDEDDSQNSPRRSRSRSKSPRNVNYNSNGELMFDAAMYAPERPKRNRNKRPEDAFSMFEEVSVKPQKTQKRKAPEKASGAPKKKSLETKVSDSSTKKMKKVSKEDEEDGPPKAKKKCTKKSTQDSENSKKDESKSPNKCKADKSSDKPKRRYTKKATSGKDDSPSKGQKNSTKKVTKKASSKSEAASKPSYSEGSESDHSDTEAPSASKKHSVGKSKKTVKNNPDTPNKKLDTKVTKSTPKSERASKPKKSPAKIEIDGIEITELSDLNSSREDDFNSSRESLNLSNNENETSVETVLYESTQSVDSGAEDQKHQGAKSSPEKGEKLQSSKEKDDLSSSNGLCSPDHRLPVPQSHTSPIQAQGPFHSPTMVSPPNQWALGSYVDKFHTFSSPNESEGNKTHTSPSKADIAPTTMTVGDILNNTHSGVPSEGASINPKTSGEKKMLPCPQAGCKYEGKSGVLLRKHMRNHGIFECAHCDFVERAFDLLESHMRENHPTRWGRKKCKKCSRHIRTDLHEEHERDCDGTKIWKCDECGNDFPFESTLKEHKKKHKKQFQCEKCEFKCDTKHNLKSHVECCHNEKRTKDFECSQCKKAFFTAQHLQSHMQSHNNGDYPCPECSKSFKTEQSLSNHRYVHQEEAKCECEVEGCAMKFKTPRLLNYHRKEVHKLGLTKIFKCEYDGCTMEFPRKSHLKKHIGIHTGERRFSCDWEGCNKTFRHNANLKIHYMQHTGEKPIKCEHCDFACRQRSSILFHMKTKHPGLPIPRTDRGRSPRRDGSTTPRHQSDSATKTPLLTTKHDTSTEDTQDYMFDSPPPVVSASAPVSMMLPPKSDITSTPKAPVDPKVYDFPDDDEEEGMNLPLKKPPLPLKSPIRSLSEMESRIESGFGSMAEERRESSCQEQEDVEMGDSSIDQPDEKKEEEPLMKSESYEDLHEDSLKEKEPAEQEAFEQPTSTEQQQQSVKSDTASQNTETSKYSDIAQEHVSENFPINSSEGTTPVEPVDRQSQGNDEEQIPNPIEGALNNTDDLDDHLLTAGNESDVIDEKMLRSPMSTISEDMRALNMPHVSMINDSGLAMSPNKKEDDDDDDDDVPHKLDDMPPEIDANEVDALLESGILDGHHSKVKEGEMPDEHDVPDVPSDYNEVMAQKPGSNISSHPETPSSHYPQPASFPGYPPSCGDPQQQQPGSNLSQQLTPERERAPPSYEASTYPLPEYPPLSSASQQPPGLPPPPGPPSSDSSPPGYASQSQPPPPSAPTYQLSQSPTTGLHYSPPSVTSSSLPTYPPTTSVTAYQPPTPTTTISSFPSLPPVTSSFLEGTLSGRSSLDPLTSMARSTDVFGAAPTTTSTTVTSSSTYTSSTYPSTRDLFGHYFPTAADPSSLPLSHLPPPPTQDQRALTSAYSQSPSSFQALQRSSADLLQRASASALPGMNYPSVTESLARLNPSLGAAAQQSSPSWPTMPGHDERSRAWPNPSSLMPELDNASPLSRNPFSASRPEYNFDAATAAAKRPESAFPGVPQSVANPPDRYDVASAYNAMGASHFNSAAAAAAASSNYARTMTPGLNTHMPDYRALSQPPTPAAMADMYGRMGMNPALGLDKYYSYSRDAMYRSQHSLVSTANPFMPQTTTAQMSGYGERDYARNPMYSQESAYGKYLPSTNIAQSMPTLPERPADYFQPRPGAATADPYMHDPYRRSVIHNMINRYF